MSASPQIRAGVGITLASLLFGQTLSANQRGQYRHPWFTQPAWSPLTKQWVATVKEGYVNAQVPVYRATVQEQENAGNPWDINPLTGKQFFSDPIFAQQQTSQRSRTVDLPLYLQPAIPLDFRNLGFDGEGPVPQFFLDRGVVNPPPSPDVNAVADGTPLTIANAPLGLRLLRVCDLWVHQPRAALTSSVELNPAGYLTGAATVLQTLGIRSAPAGDRLRIMAGTLVLTTAPIDPLGGDYEEVTFDQKLISQVFLLSPPNTPAGSAPDQTWAPFVRHNLFWSLKWAQPRFRITVDDTSLVALPALAGGAASLLITSYESQITNQFQQALNILTGHSLAGSFWTATGGGTDALVPTAPAAIVPAGLDKRARLYAEAQAALALQRSVSLDPAFPYRAEPFDFSLLR